MPAPMMTKGMTPPNKLHGHQFVAKADLCARRIARLQRT